MSTTVTRTLVENDRLLRLQEIIFDISFNIGNDWKKLNEDFRGALMDHLGGSRGLKDKVVEWAGEFDKFWESLYEGDKEDYYEKIDQFTYDRFSKLCADLGKKRIMKGAPA